MFPSFRFSFLKSSHARVRCDDRSEVETFPYIRCVHFSPVVSHRLVNLFKRTGRDENVSSFQFRRACHADTRSPFLTAINQRVHPFNRSLSLSAETACVYAMRERGGGQGVCVCMVCGWKRNSWKRRKRARSAIVVYFTRFLFHSYAYVR